MVATFSGILVEFFKLPSEGHGDVLYFLADKSNGIRQMPIVAH